MKNEIKIETKFSIDDRVYIIQYGEIKRTTIFKIICHVDITKKGQMKYIRYVLNNISASEEEASFKEEDLFASHEDFIDHLKFIDIKYENG